MRLAYLTEFMARQKKLDASVYRKLTTGTGGGKQSLAQQVGQVAFLREVFADVVPRRKRKKQGSDGPADGR